MLQIPKTWDNLEQFALWYKRNNFPVRPPADGSTYATEQTFSWVMFRQGRYQAEMYFAKPNTVSTKHSHPFDQIIIFLGGKMAGSRGTEEWSTLGDPALLPPEYDMDLPGPDYGKLGKKLSAGEWHLLEAFEKGFCFIVCQDWGDMKPSSAIIEYNGPAFGKEHEALKGTGSYGGT